MRTLLLILFVAMFLPSLGLARDTGFGRLEFSDFVVVPYLALAWFMRSRGTLRQADKLIPWLLLFFVWATLSTLLITDRYGYANERQLWFALLKLGKLALYATAGIYTAKALADPTLANRFPWAWLGAAAALGISLYLGPTKGTLVQQEQARFAYKASNEISVAASIVGCYVLAWWLGHRSTRLWRTVTPLALLVLTVGVAVSQGRGGWVAGLAGLLYIGWRMRGHFRVVATLAAAGAMMIGAYYLLDGFRHRVESTVRPNQSYLHQYRAGVMGVDDGARITTWLEEIPKILDDPLLGRGFFHRGGHSGLWWTGSHNFFIQMFLETGVLGGLLVIGIFALMWRQAGSSAAKARGIEVPAKSALLAAIVGGMSGEYFYGGVALFAVLACYACCGALGISDPACSYRQPRCLRHRSPSAAALPFQS